METAEARSDRITRLSGGTRVPGAHGHVHMVSSPLSAGRGSRLHTERRHGATGCRGRQWGRRKRGPGGDGALTLEHAGSAALGCYPGGTPPRSWSSLPAIPETPQASHSGAPQHRSKQPVSCRRDSRGERNQPPAVGLSLAGPHTAERGIPTTRTPHLGNAQGRAHASTQKPAHRCSREHQTQKVGTSPMSTLQAG